MGIAPTNLFSALVSYLRQLGSVQGREPEQVRVLRRKPPLKHDSTRARGSRSDAVNWHSKSFAALEVDQDVSTQIQTP
jgi:hypothetical protein